MSVRQLYQLQSIELEIESAEQAVAKTQAKLNENEELRQAKAKLSKAQSQMDALLQQQKDNDWAIADISAKITVTNETLYSGRVRNSKELTSLQQELDALKHRRDPLEENAMTFMEQIENSQAGLKKLEEDLKSVETRLRGEHQAQHAQIDEFSAKLTTLREQREQAIAVIPPEEVSFYNSIKTRRPVAVSRVDKGICGHCRISLSSSEVQRARSGKIVQCSSCSRILFCE